MKKISLSIIALLILTSCGFHLRGQYQIPEALRFVVIQGEVSEQLLTALNKQFDNIGITVAKDLKKIPRAYMQLSTERFEKNINSLSTTGQVKDYNLNYSVIFSIFASKQLEKRGQTIFIDKQQVKINRLLDVDQQSVLASSNEESAIRAEMYDELARMIMFRIQALTKRKD